MEWLREQFLPPSKPTSWNDHWISFQDYCVQCALAAKSISMDILYGYIIPALCVVFEKANTCFQKTTEYFYTYLLPRFQNSFEQVKIYGQIFGTHVYEYAFLFVKQIKTFSGLLGEHVEIFVYRIADKLNNVYTYFSLFPTYKLYCMCIILILMLCCVFLLIYTCKTQRQSKRALIVDERTSQADESTTSVERDLDVSGDANLLTKAPSSSKSFLWTLQLCILTFYGSMFLISIPWEFIHLYQSELAQKATITLNGMPDSCLPQDNLTTWQSLKGWFMWQLSWSHDPCEQYHRALMVDPFWEVTPMMVLSSSFTKCVTIPLETLSSGVGRSVRNLFLEIPVTWQPILMITLVVLLLTSLLMMCSYKLCLPLLLRLEPAQRTPVIYRTCKVRKTRKHKRHRKEKYLNESDNSFDHSY